MDEQRSSPGGPAPEDDDDDIAELQRHMDEYNLKHSQEGEDEDEDDVEATMRTTEEESQDL